MQRFNYVTEEIRKQAGKIKDRLVDKIKEGNPVIFGAGNCGHRIYDLLHGYGIQVFCFCDNGIGGGTDEVTGLRIIKPEELLDAITHPEILACVGEEKVYQSISQQLLSLGFDEAQIHNMNEFFYWQTREYFDANIEAYREAYQLLEDEFSRQVYLQRMKKAFLLSDISQIVSPLREEYFDEKVVLKEDEVFIDCGGFDGDSALRFIEQSGGKYQDIIIFEPEFSKKAVIEKNMEKNHYELHQLGVWSKKEKLYFDAVGTCSSHIVEKEGNYVIETAALDEIIFDKRPTYIKMDIEGAEQEALKGCRKIIQTYKPKLAICIYHKPDDLYKIPIMIKEMNPEYKLYVRQYANAWFDTVLYAV
jgi:FkbM family methyltransferase